MNLPKFITFTGADEHTNVHGMLALAARYPIEWGVLFSPKRQGTGRYPPLETAWKFQASSPALRLSAHLCGQYATDTIDAGGLPLYRQAFDLSRFIKQCQRVQINTTRSDLNVGEVSQWGASMGVRVIYQSRDEHCFPADDRCDWLFDNSGGRGVSPGEWPRPEIGSPAIHGYAGGLNQDNVARNVESIEWEAGANYWIDMESGVRDADDRFDLAKCEAICRAVYGEGAL